jgi:hypothetical protein
MRKHNVFGKKLSQIRPFYVLLVVFIVIIPAHFALNYFQESKLETLKEEQTQLDQQVNSLLENYQFEVDDEITAGDVYSGFKHYYFDYYLEEDINLFLDLTELSLVESKNIFIESDVNNPFEESLPEELTLKKVSLEFVLTEQDNLFNFLDLLLNENQLFYIDNVNVSLLVDDSLAVAIDIYVFYLN